MKFSVLSILFISSSISHAALTTIRFSGSVDIVRANLIPYFQVGDTFTFDVTFDTNAPDVRESATFLVDPGYLGESGFLSIDATGGSFDVSVINPRIRPENKSGFDRYSIDFFHPGHLADGVPATAFTVVDSSFGGSLSSAGLSLFDATGTALNSDALPSELNRSDWSENGSESSINMFFDSGTSNDQLRLAIADIQTIPEPSSVMLVGLGGIALLMRRTRK